jgi:RNA polymerase sigma factor (sigma-70 family)
MENVFADSAPVRLRRPARLLRLASDERLVALVRAGDEGAFEALYDRHHPAILGFCRHMLGSREEAEDAVQHTFLAAFRDLVGSDKAIDLRPWLFAIARNRCLSLLRARRAHVAIELAEPASDGLAAAVELREDLRELLADLARLPEDQRAALLLAELGALDHAGIATVLGCPREKVKALVFQARTSLAASREARATPCDEIRTELATASGAALRRGALRRHLRTCDGCQAFKAEVATQRKLLALALPVVPSMALKASILSGSGSGGASAASGGAAVATSATTVAATSGASGGTLGGVLGTVAATGVGKVAVSLAVVGAVAGGGVLTGQVEHRGAASPSQPASDTGSHSVYPQSFRLGMPASGGAVARSPHVPTAPSLATGPSLADPSGASGTAPSGPGHQTPPAQLRNGGIAPAPPTLSPAMPAQPPSPAPGAGGIRRQGEGAPPTPTPTLPPQSQGKPPDSVAPAPARAPPTTIPPAGSGAPATPPGGGNPSQAAPPASKPSQPAASGDRLSTQAGQPATPGPVAGDAGPSSSASAGGPTTGPSRDSPGRSGAAHGPST